MADEEFPEASLKDILDNQTLRWVFVGGKGGVGKTTTSCSLAVQLAKVRRSVLLISTDPAHNLSDAFNQKFGAQPTLVNGFTNLHAMEIDPSFEANEEDDTLGEEGGLLQQLAGTAQQLPGIDEAMTFQQIVKLVKTMNYSITVFDTAPTGHTLRLLNFPNIIEESMGKLFDMKTQTGAMMQQLAGLFGGGSQENMFAKMEELKSTVNEISRQFKDRSKTTFVAVCVPEFLSLYETERLVQELHKFEIDIGHVVVNQVLYPETDSKCGLCLARSKMQQKYIDQIYDLYEDYHIVLCPLLKEEVRGVDRLKSFSENLRIPYEEPE